MEMQVTELFEKNYRSKGRVVVNQGGTGVSALDDILGTANQIAVSAGADTIIGGDVTLSLPSAVIIPGSLEIPNAAAPTVDAVGEIALDTNDGFNLILATSTNATDIVFGGGTTTLYAFAIASTSPDFLSGGIVQLPSHFLAQVVVAIICRADAGTSFQIFVSDGINNTNTITCTTTSTQFQFTTNNTFTAYENIEVEFATISGVVDRGSVNLIGYRQTN